MKFKYISLTTASGCPESLTNMLFDYDTTIITDMIEDAKTEKEVYQNLEKLYAKQGRGSILRKPFGERKTEDYYRITLTDRLNNVSYLKITY